ncbi:MAG: DUF4136 domain-containing protein [Planctomycetes bacterium]|nr:DUF4136 domain-containing protein [Planctomycetota bacterium]
MHGTQHRLFSLALLASCLALAACAGPARIDADFDFGAVDSYAWKEPPSYASPAAGGEPGELDDLARRVQRQLERRGIELVAKPRARVLLSATLRIETRVEQLDPNYSVYSAQQFEVCTMTLDVYDRERRQLVWSDRTTRRLRTTGHRFGRRLAEEFSPTDQPRDWQIHDMVDELIARLPR